MFYLLDHVVLLRPQELLYEERLPGSWKFRFNRIPYLIFNKDIRLINPFTPWLCVFRVRWHEDGFPTSRAAIKSERIDFLRFLRDCWELRLISTCSFMLIFIVGPYLTASRGLAHGLFVVAVLNVLFQLFAASSLLMSRSALRLTSGKILFLIFEGVICPPYAACLLRRASLNYTISCDGLIFGKSIRRTLNLGEVFEHARLKIEDLPNSEALQDRLRAQNYLSRLQP